MPLGVGMIEKGLLRHYGFAAAAVLALVILRLLVSGPDDLDDIDRFHLITGASVGPETPFFANGLNGDGATFAVVAIDPLGREIGGLMEQPSFRYMRLGYPLTASALVGGADGLVLLGLSVVGLLSVGICAYVASSLHDTLGSRAWLLVCNPALLLGFMGDTAEPMALALLSLAIYTGSAFLAWTIALIRPSYLLALASRWRVMVLGLVTAGLVKLYWSWHFGEPYLSGSSNISWPFSGVLESPSILGWLVVISGLVTVVVGLLRRDMSWLVGGVLAVCLAPVVIDTPTNAVRAAGFLPVLWAFGPNFNDTRRLSEVFSPPRRSSHVGGPS